MNVLIIVCRHYSESPAVVSSPSARSGFELDGLLEDDGGIPEQQCVDVERLGRRTYVVRFPEGGELPELAEAPLMQRIAAQVQFVPRAEVERTERAD